MKFLLPVALLAVAVAAGSDCEAENIVDACLKSTEGQMSNCDGADYDCLCSAQQSIATCFNNCPNDSRAGDAQGQVQIHCGNASVFGSSAAASPTKSSKASPTDSESKPTDDADADDEDSTDDSSSSFSNDEEEGGATGLGLNAAMVLGVAGVVGLLV